MGNFLITSERLHAAIGAPGAPLLIDVRRRAAFEADGMAIPSARWRDHAKVDEWAGELPPGADIVCYCVHGHQVSQSAVARLRAAGIPARTLKDGIEGWRSGNRPLLRTDGLPGLFGAAPGIWVTRRRPKIDRLACPWLIRRFIDPQANFLFVDPDQVLATAGEVGGIAYDIDGAEITHEGELCSFDVILRRSGITDPALDELALIIRGADTARLDLAPEAAGLLAISIGISAISGEDDHGALERGIALYDALYAWRRKAPGETHNWPTKGAGR